MKFDYEAFFASEGVEFFTEGKNVRSGCVSLRCPFCNDDPSNHLNANPATGGYSCFRNREHWGSSPVKLIQEIKRCTYSEAKAIAGGDEIAVGAGSLEEMEQQIEAIANPAKTVSGHRILTFPKEFKVIENRGLTKLAYQSLFTERLFNEDDIPTLCRDYRVRYAVAGDFRKRLILPFLIKGNVVGWSARALGDARLRYISYPADAAKKNLLFNHGPASAGGKVLVIVEGGFGALKIDLYGRHLGIRAVATLGTNFTEAQVGLIYRLAKRFNERIIVLFDHGAEMQAHALAGQLSLFRVSLGELPEWADGPGDLEPNEVVPLITRIAKLWK